jgi:hypothetical protein
VREVRREQRDKKKRGFEHFSNHPIVRPRAVLKRV